jgi:hypothetical protein
MVELRQHHRFPGDVFHVSTPDSPPEPLDHDRIAGLVDLGQIAYAESPAAEGNFRRNAMKALSPAPMRDAASHFPGKKRSVHLKADLPGADNARRSTCAIGRQCRKKVAIWGWVDRLIFRKGRFCCEAAPSG